MRSFEDRMAEIRRRSGEMIKVKKRNRAIVLSCVPLVLCVGLSLLLWQNRAAVEPTTDPGRMEMESVIDTRDQLEALPEQPTFLYGSQLGDLLQTIRVTDPQGNTYDLQPDRVQELKEYLQQLCWIVTDYACSDGSNDDKEMVTGSLQEPEASGQWQWTMLTPDGTQQYILQAAELFWENQRVTLSQEQLNQLHELLAVQEEVD